jgi:hypothetical protein
MISKLLRRLVPLAAVFAVSPAMAELIAVDAVPATQNVAFGSPASVSIVWTVRRVNTGNCGNTVSSPQGNVIGSAAARAPVTLYTVPTTLTQTKPGCTGGPDTVFVFSESVLIPQSVIQTAHDQGFSQVRYSRTFNDNIAAPPITQYVTLNITSSSAAGFSLSRLALAFDNGSAVRVLDRKASTYATAEINFNGSGLLQGFWEIAGPTSTAGEPIYHPIGQVQQYLVGSTVQTLKSPLLPTDAIGLYLVRLRVTSPAPGFDVPVIRYFVADEHNAATLPTLPLSLLAPPTQALLAQDTAFAWEAIRGARVYQLEIYEAPRLPGDNLPDLGGNATAASPALPRTPPVAGVLVPGAQTRVALSSAVRSHLTPGRRYLWRVLAISINGHVVGESPVRELRVP